MLLTYFSYSAIISASSSLPDIVNGFFIISCKGTASFMNKPEYECDELFHLCLNEGMVVVALEPKALIGSPKYLILLGLALLSGVTPLEKSDNIFFTYIST